MSDPSGAYHNVDVSNAMASAPSTQTHTQTFRGCSTRRCRDCQADISHRHSNSFRCEDCQKAANRKHYRERYRKRYAMDPEYRAKELQRCRERYATNPEFRNKRRKKKRELFRERYATDPEYRNKILKLKRERRRERYATDPEYRNKRRKRQREWHREQWDTDPEFRAKRRERIRKQLRERYATDPEYRAKMRKRTRERNHRLGGQGYRRELPLLLMRQQWLCALCGDPIDEITADVHVDHILPVSKGGGNEVENLQATHGPCNTRKGNRTTTAF